MPNTKTISRLTLYLYLNLEDSFYFYEFIESLRKLHTVRSVDYQGHCFWKDVVKLFECNQSKSLLPSLLLRQLQSQRQISQPRNHLHG